MLSALTDAASGLVPNRGWFIFGGYNSSLLRMQKLQTVGGNFYFFVSINLQKSF
jgi:hypothetical protein